MHEREYAMEGARRGSAEASGAAAREEEDSLAMTLSHSLYQTKTWMTLSPHTNARTQPFHPRKLGRNHPIPR